jgi:hypothetical protein
MYTYVKTSTVVSISARDVIHKCESLPEIERLDRILTRHSRSLSHFSHIFLLRWEEKKHSGSAAAILRRPRWSSTGMLSLLLKTICHCTMWIQLNILYIASQGKFSQACFKSIRISPLVPWLHSTADWMFIQMPRSRAFTSGEHTDCFI